MYRRQAQELSASAPADDMDLIIDDEALVEILLGDRPWQSQRAALRGVRKTMGDEAENQEKFREEGQFETKRRIWGLDYRSREETASLSPAKLGKMARAVSTARWYGECATICSPRCFAKPPPTHDVHASF